ncbi:unnamed protein product [Hymenolepis diminuta]|uniref:LRRCT domain-containing protein n=1 Tax=Hymenolepis diminuta TaxID=6216 RepID=A0A0R3SR58_HYMDI|nr:unnamed protein product [Hymenolepis diminuta]VUZ45371.1 unnamed protein product [Hymenolepis diminuta]
MLSICIHILILVSTSGSEFFEPQGRGLLTRPLNVICPSNCECNREENNNGSPAYSAECHVATNTLPVICARSWSSLKINLINYTSTSPYRSFRTKPVFSYCHDLASLYVRQTGDNPVGFALHALLQGLGNLRRIWLHNVNIEIDGVETANFYKISPKLELIAFSDCSMNLDNTKPLFFDTPTNLQQLRLTNVSLTGPFTSRYLVNLCHTSTNAFRPNDLVSLYLDRNYIKSLDRNSLSGCRNLKVLQLSYNQLSGSLDEVMGLGSRILGHNWTSKRTLEMAATFESGVLGHALQLEAIDLSGNFITGIRSPFWAYGREGAEIRCLTELKTISLSNNNLTYIVRGAFQGAPNLREIDLSRNPKLFCPMHLEAPAFYSYIDPYIFGGVQKLTKVYWDFADKTCLLSALKPESSYGVLSVGVFKLFASRALCLTEITRPPPVNNELPEVTSSMAASDRKRLSVPERSIEKALSISQWTSIDIISSFLCALMGLLLIVLFVTLAFRGKILLETLISCCEREKGFVPTTTKSQENPSIEQERPNVSTCYTLPSPGRGGLLLLHEDESERLNNGLKSSSLQNLCLACLDHPTPSSTTVGMSTISPLQFYDNYKNLTTSFLEGNSVQISRAMETGITRALVESRDRPMENKANINDWSYI